MARTVWKHIVPVLSSATPFPQSPPSNDVGKFMTIAQPIMTFTTTNNRNTALAQQAGAGAIQSSVPAAADPSRMVHRRGPPRGPANCTRGISQFRATSPRPDFGVGISASLHGMKAKTDRHCLPPVKSFFTYLRSLIASVDAPTPVETEPTIPITREPLRESPMQMSPPRATPAVAIPPVRPIMMRQMPLGWYQGGEADEYYRSFLTTPVTGYEANEKSHPSLPERATEFPFPGARGSHEVCEPVYLTSLPPLEDDFMDEWAEDTVEALCDRMVPMATPARRRMVLSDCFPEGTVREDSLLLVESTSRRVSLDDCFSVGSSYSDEEDDSDADSRRPGELSAVVLTACRVSLFPSDAGHEFEDLRDHTPTSPETVSTDRGRSSISLNSEDCSTESDISLATRDAVNAVLFAGRRDGPQHHAVLVRGTRRRSWAADICEASDDSDDDNSVYEADVVPCRPRPNLTIQVPQSNSAYEADSYSLRDSDSGSKIIPAGYPHSPEANVNWWELDPDNLPFVEDDRIFESPPYYPLRFTADYSQACLTHFAHFWEDPNVEPVDQSLFADFDTDFDSHEADDPAQRKAVVLVDNTTQEEINARIVEGWRAMPHGSVWEYEEENMVIAHRLARMEFYTPQHDHFDVEDSEQPDETIHLPMVESLRDEYSRRVEADDALDDDSVQMGLAFRAQYRLFTGRTF